MSRFYISKNIKNAAILPASFYRSEQHFEEVADWKMKRSLKVYRWAYNQGFTNRGVSPRQWKKQSIIFTN